MISRLAGVGLLALGVMVPTMLTPAGTADLRAASDRRTCPPDVEIPARWPAASVRSEDEVLARINLLREQGVTCRATRTRHRPVPALEEDRELRQAARMHSAYMAQKGAFDHTLEGCAFSTWIDAAGYEWRSVGENIALRRGTRVVTAEAVVDRWLASKEGHCETLMDPKWRAAGVGHARAGTRQLWTVDFGDR